MQNRFPAHSVSFVFLLLGSVWGNLSAQPAPPPVVCVDDLDCVETAPPTGGTEGPDTGGSYTLASIGSVPFAYSTPALPVITSEATVNPSTITANKVNGRRLILTPGTYGDQSFNTLDQEVVLTTGVTINVLSITASVRRFKVTANPIRSGSIAYIRVSFSEMGPGAAQDVTFDGINQSHVDQPGAYPFQRNDFRVQRLAILNSSFLTRDFVFLSFSSPGAERLEDVVIANNNMVQGGSAVGGTGLPQAAFRTQGARRFVFVDNRLVGYAPGQRQNFRIHAQPDLKAEYFWVSRNQFEGPGHAFQRTGTGGTSLGIENVWYVDNTQYCNFQSAINVENSAQYWPTTLTITGNTLYSSSGGYPSIPPGYAWTVSGNPTSGYQAPPPWSFK